MLTNEDIVAISQNILSTMLEMEATQCTPELHLRSKVDVVGRVQIHGTWHGTVVVQVSDELAKTFASRLLQLHEENVSEEDVRDAFAEMTNMIGGNIKGQVPAPSTLSLPEVLHKGTAIEQGNSSSMIRDVTMHCEGENLRVMLFE
jgi:chemotaxis protein CheX